MAAQRVRVTPADTGASSPWAPSRGSTEPAEASETDAPPDPPRRARAPRAPEPSGRQRHEEKITVYVSAAELLALEQARLELRSRYGVIADRGRIVREAVAALLNDLDAHGESSLLVRRLSSG